MEASIHADSLTMPAWPPQPRFRPEGWPLTLSEVEVWIMPSPSGRAVIPHKERLATYIDLAEILADEGM